MVAAPMNDTAQIDHDVRAVMAMAPASDDTSEGAVDTSYSPLSAQRSRSAADSAYHQISRGADTLKPLDGSHGPSWPRPLHGVLTRVRSTAPEPTDTGPTRQGSRRVPLNVVLGRAKWPARGIAGRTSPCGGSGPPRPSM